MIRTTDECSTSFARRPGARHGRAVKPLAAGAAALLIALAGCQGKLKGFENENDTLRRQVLEQQKEIDRLKAQNGELSAKLAEATAEIQQAGRGPAADVIAALPRCAGIKLGSATGWVDKDGTPGPEGVEAIVSPFDGRQRFVQVAGTLRVEAYLLPPIGAGSAPLPLGSATLTPTELREAYRSSFMGTYYSILIPLQRPNQPAKGKLLVRASFTDAVSGKTFEAERTID